jgi:hypothetical protein
MSYTLMKPNTEPHECETHCHHHNEMLYGCRSVHWINLLSTVKQSSYTPWRCLGGEEVQLLLIHDVGTRRGVSGQRHAPAALYPRGKAPRYPLYSRLGGPQSRSGHRGYRKNPLPLPGIEPRSPGRSVRSQTLYCLSYPGSRVCISTAL